MHLFSILIFIGYIVSSFVIGQKIRWNFGFCKQPRNTLNDFDYEQFFTGSWYPQKMIGGLPWESRGTCPGLLFRITDSGRINLISYHFEPFVDKYITTAGYTSVQDIKNGIAYFPVTMQELGGMLSLEIPFRVIGANYSSWAVIYGCKQYAILKLEIAYIAARSRYPNLTEEENKAIELDISEAKLNKFDFEPSLNENCPPNEPVI